ncbi:hypothetical protein P9436_11160 [Lysinibacillus capsici]|uniref:hypothetical protein n=1 Tax=Lysinibacillus capsici TaxID=2115968 RepID=UPI002E2252F7|nr:hypothetical protein [Lysinibacillus capsici]
MSVYLEEMLSAWNQQERNKVNENWRRIMATFTNLQRQINILAGGEEVDELLQRLNDAVESATIAVQESIDANNTATQDAITANKQALLIALDKIGAALTDVGDAIQAAETATNDAVEAKDAALQAAGDAQTTISQMQVIISNFRPRGEWNATTDYFKNNLAGLNGKTYIALQNNTNKPVTDTSFWVLFADRGAKGERGEKGEPGTGIKVLGHFNDVSELPSNPTLGDAYTIGADRDLYVYNGNDWQNLGSIKGVEGKSAYEVAVENGFVGTEIEWLETLIGPPGPDGPPGPPADLTEINQKVDGIQNEVTEHLADTVLHSHYVSGALDDTNTFNINLLQVTEYKEGMRVIIQNTGGHIKTGTVGININGLGRKNLLNARGGSFILGTIGYITIDAIYVNGGFIASNVQQLIDTYDTANIFAPPTANALKNLNDVKANKQQENWITATLLNGWTGTLKYYKDEFNVLHIQALLGIPSGGGIGTKITIFPVGYRHNASTTHYISAFGSPVISSPTTVIAGQLNLQPQGDLELYGTALGNSVRLRIDASVQLNQL